VFAVVHELPLRIAQHRAFTGFRIDHVDGLLDPQGYLEELQRSWRRETGRAGDPSARCYLVVEKILTGNERLPSEWPIDGTTGYEVAQILSGLLVKEGSGRALGDLWTRFTGLGKPFSEIVYESKKLMLRGALAAEWTVLARRLDRLSEQHRYTRDFTLNDLQFALGEIIACFPVYRTYVRPGDTIVGERDHALIDRAIAEAKRRNPLLSASIFDFIRSILLLDVPAGLGATHLAERRDFVLRFQQLSGPVMAKGLEDTAFYRYFPLVALNEVGGDPDVYGLSVDQFHQANAERSARVPNGMSATATHDSKRGEDTRARLYGLSEIPAQWEAAVTRWRELNRRCKGEANGVEAPDAADEYLLYQTLVGTWTGPPDASYVERIKDYMRKARMEAKRHTSWINPNKAYDDATDEFIEATLDRGRNGAFLDDLAGFVAPIARAGYATSLAQLVLKIASPGVPDFYQGTELWDFSLVDPDNRRLVDYGVRREALAQLVREAERRPAALAAELFARPEDGRIKLLCTARALRFRRDRRAWFDRGSYEPLRVTGRLASHVVAFARVHEGRRVVAVAGRQFVSLGGEQAPTGAVWGDTAVELPASTGSFREALTGTSIASRGRGSLAVADAFAHLPVALLEEVA
jgi:(1->4)-alpha-D-glucan 1-alpha-D-glucosylmutase